MILLNSSGRRAKLLIEHRMHPVDYAAVLADLERRKDEIETAILAIRRLVNPSAAGLPPADIVAEKPRAFPFLGMTIPEATIAHLRVASNH